MVAFQRGIEAAVRPGDTVCEIGTGLGTYAFMAARAGAAKVYAIDEGPIIEIAKKLYVANKKDLGEIEFIKQHSTLVHLPEQVDVVIYENYDSQGLSTSQESVLKDARRRFLKPDGTFVPCGLELYWAPLQAEKIWQQEVSCLKESEGKVLGLNYALIQDLALNERVQTPLEAEAVLSSPFLLDSINFAEKQELELSRELTMNIAVPGILHGFGSWADFIFPGGHSFSLSYEKPVTTYSRAFFPLPEPVSVDSGDCIQMKVSVMKKPLPNNHSWSWGGEIFDHQGHKKAKWQNSTLHLAPFQQQDTFLVQSLDPGYRPVLNKEGYVRRFILDQMDGKKTLQEIAEQTTERFPEEFSSLGDALTKVARLVKKCSA